MEQEDSLEEKFFQLDYNGYKPIEKLGSGFCSYVFKVERGSDIKAVKVPKSKEFHDMIKQGVKPLLMLKGHPNIVEILCDDYLEHPLEDFPYYFMEYLDGKNLEQKVPERARDGLSVNESINVMVSLVDALEYAHGERIYHSDIRPCNVFILNDGRVKLTDFDIARIASIQKNPIVQEKLRKYHSDYQAVVDRFGNPAKEGIGWAAPIEWLAPESKQGIFNEKSDIYQLAKLFHYILTGRVNSGIPSKESIVERIGEQFSSLYEIIANGIIDTPEHRKITLSDIKNICLNSQYSKEIPLFMDYIDKYHRELDFSLENLVDINFPNGYSSGSEYKRKTDEVKKKSENMIRNASFLIEEYTRIKNFINNKNLTDIKSIKEEMERLYIRLFNRFLNDKKSILKFCEYYSKKRYPNHPEYNLIDYLYNYVTSFESAPKEIKDMCRSKELGFF